MTTLQTAAQQALEVLTANQYAVANQAPHGDVMAYNATIDALSDALEQPEPEPVAWECKSGGLRPLTQTHYDAQPDNIKRHYTRIAPPHCPNCASLEAQNNELDRKLAEMERAEPVAWRFQSAVGGWAYGSQPPLGRKYPAYPLYAAPPQRKPLTEEEVERICEEYHSPRQLVRATERAHGIKE